MSIVSARYLYDENGVIKTNVQLNLGTNDSGDTILKHIPIDINRDSYTEIMRQVTAGTLTIADAD